MALSSLFLARMRVLKNFHHFTGKLSVCGQWLTSLGSGILDCCYSQPKCFLTCAATALEAIAGSVSGAVTSGNVSITPLGKEVVMREAELPRQATLKMRQPFFMKYCK